MLSRVANSIYWMNRYIERAENVARLIDVNLRLMLDLPGATTEQWEPLLHATGDPLIFQERFGDVTRDSVVAFLTFDAENPNSIFSCLQVARENARSVRQTITSDMWEQINKFYLMVRATAAGGVLESPHDFFTEVKIASHLYEGITDATMSHSEGWHFGHLGRLLERADMTSRILDAMYSSLLPAFTEKERPVDDIQWSALLNAASAFEMYRQGRGRITPQNVADFLILDRAFPRSINSCVAMADESLHSVSNSLIGDFQNVAEQRLGRLRSELARIQIQEIISNGLHEFLVAFQTNLNHVGEAIFDNFLASHPSTVTFTDDRSGTTPGSSVPSSTE